VDVGDLRSPLLKGNAETNSSPQKKRKIRIFSQSQDFKGKGYRLAREIVPFLAVGTAAPHSDPTGGGQPPLATSKKPNEPLGEPAGLTLQRYRRLIGGVRILLAVGFSTANACWKLTPPYFL
jgi:hypothetical protein